MLQQKTPRHAPEVPASRRGEQVVQARLRIFGLSGYLMLPIRSRLEGRLREGRPASIVNFGVPEAKRRNSKPTPQFEHQSTGIEKSNPQGGVIFLFPLGTHQQALVSAKGDARAFTLREDSSRHIAR
jgi:hypothetical protein